MEPRFRLPSLMGLFIYVTFMNYELSQYENVYFYFIINSLKYDINRLSCIQEKQRNLLRNMPIAHVCKMQPCAASTKV